MSDWTKYADLEVRRRELEDELASVEKEMSEMREPLLAAMAEGECDKITIHGITFYPKRRLYAGVVEGFTRADVSEALIASGLEDFVQNTYNANTLNGYISSFNREADMELSPAEIKELLPPKLRECVNVGEAWSIATNKSSSAKKRSR